MEATECPEVIFQVEMTCGSRFTRPQKPAPDRLLFHRMQSFM
jgi:hypothetical protein